MSKTTDYIALVIYAMILAALLGVAVVVIFAVDVFTGFRIGYWKQRRLQL